MRNYSIFSESKMNKLFTVFFLIAFFVSACSPQISDATNQQYTAVIIEDNESRPTAVPTSHPITDPGLKITGEEELVFNWDEDRCEDENIPDLAFRAFRDKNNQVQAIISSATSFRMVGPRSE